MNKDKIKKLANWILQDIENAEHRVAGWVEDLVREIKRSPQALHERIEALERKLEGK